MSHAREHIKYKPTTPALCVFDFFSKMKVDLKAQVCMSLLAAVLYQFLTVYHAISYAGSLKEFNQEPLPYICLHARGQLNTTEAQLAAVISSSTPY